MTDQPSTQDIRELAAEVNRKQNELLAERKRLGLKPGEPLLGLHLDEGPSTQERCPTCGRPHPPSEYADAYIDCTDPWHGSQDVEAGAGTESTAARGSETTTPPASTTQEAEKALEIVETVLGWLKFDYSQGSDPFELEPVAWPTERDRDNALAALRSLRTQHTKDREEIERLQGGVEAATREIHKQGWQHTKDQERIEELEERLTKKWWNKHEHELEDRIAELERVLANLGVQLTAGGSGDPAGGEVE